MKTVAMQTARKECPATAAQALHRTLWFTALPDLPARRQARETRLQQQATNSKQVAAFVGLEHLEKSSARKLQFGSLSKKGSWSVRDLFGQAGKSAARYDPFRESFRTRLGKLCHFSS